MIILDSFLFLDPLWTLFWTLWSWELWNTFQSSASRIKVASISLKSSPFRILSDVSYSNSAILHWKWKYFRRIWWINVNFTVFLWHCFVTPSRFGWFYNRQFIISLCICTFCSKTILRGKRLSSHCGTTISAYLWISRWPSGPWFFVPLQHHLPIVQFDEIFSLQQNYSIQY